MSYPYIQSKLLEDHLLEKLELMWTTPIRIGGFNARPYSLELQILERPRASGLKGVWRWWARALISGALLELGKSSQEANKLNKLFIDPLLGSTGSASKIAINLVNLQILEEFPSTRFQWDLDRIPRIKLIRIGKDKRSLLEERLVGTSFEIELIKRIPISELEGRFAVSSLVLALTFGGLGSLTNRGFGRFKLKVSRHKEIQEKLNALYSSKDSEEISTNLEQIINMSASYAKDYVKERSEDLNRLKTQNDEPPISPSIHAYRRFFRYESVSILDSWYKSLECIGNATLKAKWKRAFRERGEQYHTWILGLPRHRWIKGRNEEYVGYKAKNLDRRQSETKNLDRRQSAIGFSVIKLNENRYSVVMYGFLTSDWHKVLEAPLEYKGGGSGATPVLEIAKKRGVKYPQKEKKASSPRDLVDHAFEAAWEYAREVIKDYSGEAVKAR